MNQLFRLCHLSVEHTFIRNIFDYEELKISKSIQTIGKHHETYRNMLWIVTLLHANYSTDSDIEDISDDWVAEFVHEMNFLSLADLCLKDENKEIKNLK